MEDKGAAGAGGEAKKRKLSKAEMVRFDEMSSDAPVEEEVMETEDEGDDGDYDDDLYN